MSKTSLDHRRPVSESHGGVPWIIGITRVAVLIVAAFGLYWFGELFISRGGVYRLAVPRYIVIFLVTLYAFNLITGVVYLGVLHRHRAATAIMTWTQVLLDFSVVVSTISVTGDSNSVFTVLLVIVILEAGLLLGLPQGFLFAMLSIVYVAVQAWPSDRAQVPPELWYDILIQSLAFLFTAFISGYWNNLIFRLRSFQREILDNLSSGFLITDRTGVISAQNRAADEMLGLPDGSALGRSAIEILRPESGGECPIMTALRSERDFTSFEFHAVTHSGGSKLLGLSTNRIYDKRHRLTGLIASFADMTEVDTMRQELHRQDRLAALGELATDVAHEIRNPVAVIRSAVEELQNSIESPEKVRKLAALALRESDHLNRIVRSFLDFTRNPVRKHDVFDVCALLREVADSLRHQYADASALSVELRNDDLSFSVAGDASQIRQVFMNLGTNAVEAMDRRGLLAIIVAPAGRSIEIHFDDEGSGLAPDQVARMFEPFYTTKQSGVGMGLAICMRIVTAHDGTLRAVPREQGGTRMTVRLPAARNPQTE
ncbi:MAG TPA: ATP-binding protein [Candidatus Hydrogenedentes bacterium]|nr:ATP-binding protein [Candidatus Hydrogenedentota bacterium]HPG68505.1 ATP-binding protein [Candidatus Hydrogenedentota bacterium]